VWASQHGLVVAAAAQEGTLTHAPLSLLPTPFPAAAYAQAMRLAAPFGELMAAVAADADFLRTTLAGACANDEFTRRLMEMFEETHLVREFSAATP
jgi:glutathione synthase